jgi:hypothetical protein
MGNVDRRNERGGIARLLAAFFIEFATAKVDARTEPLEELHYRIEKIKERLPKMIHYLRREDPGNVNDDINRFYEELGKEADIRKSYVILRQVYLFTLMYLLINGSTLLEKAEEYLRTHKKS